MKYQYALGLALSLAAATNAFAVKDGPTIRERPAQKSAPEIVNWVGTISDDGSNSHTTRHWHNLVFKNKETGKTYDIVDSDDLVKLHHETEKNYEIEIEAEKTPRVLFWGNNLIVKNFKVIAETASVPHRPEPETPRLRGSTR